MPEQMPAGGRSGPQSSEHPPHHISSIAHLFFAEGQDVDAVSEEDTVRDFTVTCFNESRISAFACAGLVAGVRSLVATGATWGVCLQEPLNVPWSSVSFLPGDQIAPEGSQASSAAQTNQWTWRSAAEQVGTPTWLRWTHLEPNWNEKRKAPGLVGGELLPNRLSEEASSPRIPPHTLVVCLLGKEMAQWETAFRLGRLLGLLEPQHLEILVFPDSWAQDSKPDWDFRRWNDRNKGPAADLLARCHNLTRAIAGACQVTITALPGSEDGPGELTPTTILEKIATRLTTDF